MTSFANKPSLLVQAAKHLEVSPSLNVVYNAGTALVWGLFFKCWFSLGCLRFLENRYLPNDLGCVFFPTLPFCGVCVCVTLSYVSLHAPPTGESDSGPTSSPVTIVVSPASPVSKPARSHTPQGGQCLLASNGIAWHKLALSPLSFSLMPSPLTCSLFLVFTTRKFTNGASFHLSLFPNFYCCH